MDYLLHTEEKALDRLSQMGLSENALTESVWQGYLARSRTTINHPRIARGIIMWA